MWPAQENPSFDDSKWTTVSTPHSFNNVDSFRTIISHSGGDRGTFKGLVWYRKHFKLPAEFAGHKLFLEFEGMRQAGVFYLNGKQVGLYENGVTGYGLDISDGVHFGGAENVLAVQVDNRTTYREHSSGQGFRWNANDFNPDHGGINRHVWLHVTGKIYQTLPLYYGLQSTGVYVHAGNFNIPAKSADVTVEAEVKNASGKRATVTLSAAIVDRNGQVRARFQGEPLDMVDGEKSVLTATGPLKDASFWSPEEPYLYDVYTILTAEDKIVDVNKLTTGFRKTEFKGGAGTGGVYINDKFVYLKGFAQRSSNEWAGFGQAYPDWMHDFNARLMRDCNANYVRWMHVSPQKVNVEACDRMGIVQICPAGDKETVPDAVQWKQRIAVMRDSMIYFRNSPSILFWEAGNTIVSPEQMKAAGGLAQGDRRLRRASGGNPRQLQRAGKHGAHARLGILRRDDRPGPADGVDQRLEHLPRLQHRPPRPGADHRDGGLPQRGRPPLLGQFLAALLRLQEGPERHLGAQLRELRSGAVARYWAYWQNRITNPNQAHARWSGYASIYFSDSDADGRQDSSEVCRVSGKVDAVRLPKEIYFAHRVIQNEKPDIHILGHWTYPAVQPSGAKTVKTMYVICNCPAVELFLNGQSIGKSSSPTDGYIFAFPKVAWQPGTLKAVGMDKEGKVACATN